MFSKLVQKWYAEGEDQFHFRVSVVKSATRIVAGLGLVSGAFVFAGLAFIVAEVLGIVEEM